MANPLLNVSDLNVFYGDAQALWDISFQVRAGEIFSIIGSNGSGKSTILKTLSGLTRPASGQVQFNGSPIGGIDSPEGGHAGCESAAGDEAAAGCHPHPGA